jgi:hypothetical protein
MERIEREAHQVKRQKEIDRCKRGGFSMAASPHCCWTRRLLIVAACFALITGVDPVFGPVSALADPGGGNSGERDTDATNLNRNTVKKKAPAALPQKKITTQKTLVVKKPSQDQINAELARRLGGDTIEAIFILGRVIKAIPGEIEALQAAIAESNAKIAAGASEEEIADLKAAIDSANAEISHFREAVPVVTAELHTLLNELPHVKGSIQPVFDRTHEILKEVQNEAQQVSNDLIRFEWVDSDE